MAIAENIKDQLLFNGRITLPGFGTLELVKESARITDNKIIPPSTGIVFDPSITDDDDRLAGSFASAGEINIEEARNLVNEYIDGIRNTLNSGGDFEIEGFGKLYKDSDDTIKFEKNPDFIIDFDSYGLESFELDLPVEDLIEAPEPPQEQVIIEESLVKPPEIKTPYRVHEVTKTNPSPKKRHKILWAIPVALIVIIAGVLILKFTTIIPDKISSKIFNFKTKTLVEKESVNLDANKSMGLPVDSLSRIENALSPDEVENSAFIAVPFVDIAFKEYHVIAGSFSDTINARELAWELTQEGYRTLILHQGNNLYRVSAISFKEKEEGLQGLHRFRAQTKNNAAWLLGLN